MVCAVEMLVCVQMLLGLEVTVLVALKQLGMQVLVAVVLRGGRCEAVVGRKGDKMWHHESAGGVSC
jgi:hypothetical protein